MGFNYFEEIATISPFTIVSTSVVLFLGILYFILKARNLPPGPIGLPVVGYWPFLSDEKVSLELQELTKKYGDVYSFNIAGKLMIHLGSIKIVKEAHVTKSDCFSKRYTDYSPIAVMFKHGVIAANGEEWKTLRKFFVQAFREYGLSSMKDYMTGPIYDSVNACIGDLKATNGASVNIIPIVNTRSSDIFRYMMFNDDKITDEELQIILEAFQCMLSIFIGRNTLLIGNIARYFIFPTRKNYKKALASHKKVVDCLMKLIKKHEESYNEDNIRDVIDSYIKERNMRREKGDATAAYFSDIALVSSLIQFVGDGIFSIAMFVGGFIRALLDYPEEQDKIYKELEDIVGKDRQVTLEDRNKLPYTNAFIQEVLRMSDFLPVIASLECTKETTLNGYRIPKGAITVVNTWACHRDPNVFEEPDAFKPSRYIIQPGKPKPEAPILFGVGKRSCAGESFTMMQVFLFVTTIVKNFRLEDPKSSFKTSILDETIEVCAYPRK